jgi:hypothetical protein
MLILYEGEDAALCSRHFGCREKQPSAVLYVVERGIYTAYTGQASGYLSSSYLYLKQRERERERACVRARARLCVVFFFFFCILPHNPHPISQNTILTSARSQNAII